MTGKIINPPLPFIDLPPETVCADRSYEREKADPTLLFMTLSVTMTSENEMPIVAPYAGVPPKTSEVFIVSRRCQHLTSPPISFSAMTSFGNFLTIRLALKKFYLGLTFQLPWISP